MMRAWTPGVREYWGMGMRGYADWSRAMTADVTQCVGRSPTRVMRERNESDGYGTLRLRFEWERDHA